MGEVFKRCCLYGREIKSKTRSFFYQEFGHDLDTETCQILASIGSQRL